MTMQVSRMRSIPSAETRVDNYAAIDEQIYFTDAESRPADVRNLLASRISASEEFME